MFKVGDKLVCIDIDNLVNIDKSLSLNYTEIYIVTKCDSIRVGSVELNSVEINCRDFLYDRNRFVLLSEQRRNKLKQLECSKQEIKFNV